MMIHHGTEAYEVGASRAAAAQKAKLEVLIEKGQASAGAVIEQIMSATPVDRIVPARKVGFGADAAGILVENREKPGKVKVHDHALQQLTSRVEMPWAYVQTLRESDWGRGLLAENLNKLYEHEPADRRYLMRFARVGGASELRGFLSDKYRRLDARPITEGLVTAVQKAGALPYQGIVTDTRVSLRAILPKLFEPVPNEIVAFGLDYQTSDFGDGALQIALFVLRMACTNLATAEDMLRQVHLGKRLSDDLSFSEQTYRLDTQTMASAVGDVVANVLAPSTTERYCAAIKQANEEKVDGFSVGNRLKAIGLSKAEQELVVEAFNSPNIEEVPAGMTTWRMSNALSWVAGKTADPRRAIELQRLAGNVIAMPKAA